MRRTVGQPHSVLGTGVELRTNKIFKTFGYLFSHKYSVWRYVACSSKPLCLCCASADQHLLVQFMTSSDI